MDQMTSLLVASLLFTFSTLSVEGSSFFVQLTESNKPQNLVPPKLPQTTNQPHENKWNLYSLPGSKIVLGCVLKNPNCDEAAFTIFDGEKETQHCGKSSAYIFKNSVGGKMTVTLTTQGKTMVGICTVSATKPYLLESKKTEDSSEHGTVSLGQTTCDCGWANKESSRIVGGQETLVNEFPFPVYLKNLKADRMFCGGSIISPYHVLTAAHCTEPRKGLPLGVIVGDHDLSKGEETNATKMIPVEKVIQHDKYDPQTKRNDISILVLKEMIETTKWVGPVCLPSTKPSLQDKWVKVMGWGKVATEGALSTVLKKANLKVIDPDVCVDLYRIKKDDLNQMCTYAKGEDSCQGDSGGPVVWVDPATNRYTQVGVVSYGLDCASTDPGINTDVFYFMDWIKSNIQASKPGTKVCTKK